jgi:hypothetical protein
MDLANAAREALAVVLGCGIAAAAVVAFIQWARRTLRQPKHLASALVSVFACAVLAASCARSLESPPIDSPRIETTDDDGDSSSPSLSSSPSPQPRPSRNRDSVTCYKSEYGRECLQRCKDTHHLLTLCQASYAHLERPHAGIGMLSGCAWSVAGAQAECDFYYPNIHESCSLTWAGWHFSCEWSP